MTIVIFKITEKPIIISGVGSPFLGYFMKNIELSLIDIHHGA